MGPSQERLDCLNGCAREKDACMLEAHNAAYVRMCDIRARQCHVVCPG